MRNYKPYQSFLSFVLSFLMAFTSMPLTAFADDGIENPPPVEETGYYLYIDQQHGVGSIVDVNDEKEYSNNYDEDVTNLMSKSVKYEAGEDVELRINVFDGLKLTDVIVKTLDGNDVDYDYDGQYATFVMPEADVNVSITAEDEEEFVQDDLTSDEPLNNPQPENSVAPVGTGTVVYSGTSGSCSWKIDDAWHLDVWCNRY